MIWGLTLKPGVPCTKVLNEEVHLSLASMESRSEFGKIWPGSFSQVVMKTEAVEVLLCTLVHGSIFQQNLDLKLMPNEKITFTVYGDCIIYISGYTSCLPHTEDGFDEDHHGNNVMYEAEGFATSSNATAGITVSNFNGSSEDHCLELIHQVSIIAKVKEEETDDILEDVYAESDRRQDGDQTDFQSPEENYQACQESQEDEKFAVIADIESFPKQSSNKDDDSGGEYQESQRNYVKQSDILNYQHTSGKVEINNSRGTTSDSIPIGMSYNSSSKASVTRNSMSASHPTACTSRVAKSIIDHLKPSLAANRSLSFRLQESKKLARSSKKTVKSSSMESSSENREHRCPVCKKCFLHVSSLVRHERIHTGVKPYQCRICFKPFSDAGNRAKHERIHMRVKPFACMYCGKTFSAATYQRQHQRVCPHMWKS
ncbi:putative cell wall protein AWA1-like [Apostichopus japonicus]|uniref:Putative cell wall protein AWA1-like n=1 Tax=Stichopus japonicus TaxID=307972 RepID=A0A2G8LDV8_STIJA|nr:putative cell wall protein AWA1-like [Apostichopus japonicus]